MEVFILLPILLPLVGAAINAFAGKGLGEKGSGWLATLMAVGAFVASAKLFFDVQVARDHALVASLGSWIGVGKLQVPFNFLIDPLSSVLMLIITGVGSLIHIFSIGYMHGDSRFSRYFVYLNLFLSSMLILVMGGNYLLMFVGWELVGLCSYLLISFWYEKQKNTDAARKAFVVNRIGDVSFVLGLLLIFVTFGTFNFAEIFQHLSGGHVASLTLESTPAVTAGVLAAICLLLLGGAAGKSAQIPLYVWLPDAMAGPTPASALIHAATMVTAGVYMITRSNPLYHASAAGGNAVALVGAVTALFAASIAVRQYDIKKVLAYSTVSQLGFMVVAAGLGAYVGGVFHLMTHAFFKALLFLGAGSVIHGMEHFAHHMATTEHDAHSTDPQDMRNMGGLARRMPITFITYLIGAFSLAGLPPFSGFWSKDEIIVAALESNPIVFALLGITAIITAFYTARQLMLVFWGQPRTRDSRHAQESGWLMKLPLLVLAALATIGGLLNFPGSMWLEHWLEPVVGKHGGEFNLPIAAFFTVMSVVAFVAAFGLYRYGGRETQIKPQTGLKGILNRGWYVDAIYAALIVKPFHMLASFLARIFDLGGIDASVNGVGRLINGISGALKPLQTGYVRNYGLVMLFGVVAVLAWFVLGAR